ncbi:hypothetical protein CDIK_3678 [Cucumispora dikerogammari]|nr:hypothetical protein CDIK_3678 [Cucumispora dikerogammari]
MVKIPKLPAQKVRYAVNKYPNKLLHVLVQYFSASLLKKVNCGKFSRLEQHRKGELHGRSLSQLGSKAAVQSKLNFTNVTKAEKIIMSFFVSQYCFVYKLGNKTLVKVFNDMSDQLPSESTVWRWRSVKMFVDNYLHDIKNSLKNHEVFLIIDEIQIFNSQFVSVLIEKISNSLKYI